MQYKVGDLVRFGGRNYTGAGIVIKVAGTLEMFVHWLNADEISWHYQGTPHIRKLEAE